MIPMNSKEAEIERLKKCVALEIKALNELNTANGRLIEEKFSLEAENARLREALKQTLKLPRPWMDGGITYPEWDAAFTLIEAALREEKKP